MGNRYPLELRKEKSTKDKVDWIHYTPDLMLIIAHFKTHSLECFVCKMILHLNELILQIKKNEQKCTDDVDMINPPCTLREETEDSEYEESSIDDISQNIASNMTVVDSETLAKSEGKPKESGAKLETKSSLPEVVVLDQQSYGTAFIFAQLLINEFSPNFVGCEALWTY